MKVDHFSNNRVRLSLTAPHAGFAYMSESFFPGWTATVNGTRATIEAANHVFRAVQVPGGPVSIELAYIPPRFMAGLAVTVAALAVVGFLARYGSRFDIRGSATGVRSPTGQVSSV